YSYSQAVISKAAPVPGQSSIGTAGQDCIGPNNPCYLEEQLQSQGRAKPLFSSQRDARLWNLYRSRYEWLKDEIKNQSPTSWGAEFLSAYQAEVAYSSDSKSK
ncbi:type VI secretion system-associated FHA domain protein, partial [Comamonas sp. JUb58]|uniref:type VI secretion system-associated FHA domain protein n=1 Tax=Comamonas sp. JUb58 TaxID=2485114 RepID=UPI0010E437BE